MNTFHNLALLQFAFGNSAHTVGTKVGVPGLDTAQTTQVFISLLPPFGNKTLVSNLFLQTIIIQFSGDGFPAIEEIIDVAGSLVVDAENWPQRLNLPFSLVRLCLSFPHLLVQFLQRGLDQLPPLRRRLPAAADLRHGWRGLGLGGLDR